MPYAPLSAPSSRRHPLLRGGRWHLARPQSRALWTAASPGELSDLFTDSRLRSRLEHLLRVATSAIQDVDTLLVFDHACVNLACAVTVRPGDDGCRWSWILQSLGDAEA